MVNEELLSQFAALRSKIVEKKEADIKKRIKANPHPDEFEYMLGCFIEMYEEQLRPIIIPLLEKGYIIDVTSGFSGESFDTQTLYGLFPFNHATQSKLTQFGVRISQSNGLKSLRFLAKEADLDSIKAQWQKIAEVLPAREKVTKPFRSTSADEFRKTYLPKDPALLKDRLFLMLMSSVLEDQKKKVQVVEDSKRVPTDIEKRLGIYVEMLEPQVQHAVLEFNKKGYSTDTSGFMDDPQSQTISGDFSLDEKTIAKLEKMEIIVITNPSGYTQLQFFPTAADMKAIKKMWDAIAALLPDKGVESEYSMTSKARNFRKKYCS